MPTEIPPALLAGSPWVLLAYGYWMLMTRRLVHRSQLTEEQARTAKAEAVAEKSLTLVEKVSRQVAALTEATERNAKTDDLSVALLRGIRRHLGIEEDERT